jgi:hypothetical protein
MSLFSYSRNIWQELWLPLLYLQKDTSDEKVAQVGCQRNDLVTPLLRGVFSNGW